MTAFARGIDPGVRVRQGQVIGFVGSTGLSTGAHVHYEILVNGRFVDPMRIRLPRGRVLEGPLLDGFRQDARGAGHHDDAASAAHGGQRPVGAPLNQPDLAQKNGPQKRPFLLDVDALTAAPACRRLSFPDLAPSGQACPWWLPPAA